MKQTHLSTSLCSLLLALSVGNLHAEEKHDTHEYEAPAKADEGNFEQHGPHEHGTGVLSVAMEDNKLSLHLDSPGMNVFGFEYAPTSDADKKTMADAQAKLWVGSNLFAFDPDAGCRQTTATLNDFPIKLTTDEAADLKNAEHDEHGETHSDVEASWTFTCTKPDAVTTLATTLFSTFSGFHKLNVEWVTDQGASSATLEKDGSIKLTL